MSHHQENLEVSTFDLGTVMLCIYDYSENKINDLIIRGITRLYCDVQIWFIFEKRIKVHDKCALGFYLKVFQLIKTINES